MQQEPRWNERLKKPLSSTVGLNNAIDILREVHCETVIVLFIDPLPPSDAVRQKKKIFLRIFSVQYRLNLENITPLKTLNFII